MKKGVSSYPRVCSLSCICRRGLIQESATVAVLKECVCIAKLVIWRKCRELGRRSTGGGWQSSGGGIAEADGPGTGTWSVGRTEQVLRGVDRPAVGVVSVPSAEPQG